MPISITVQRFSAGGRWAQLLICLCALPLWSCRPEEPIVQYRIPKAPVSEAATRPSVPEGSKAWFFKLTGPSAAVIRQMESFVQVIGSTDFSTGEPNFNLPEGWEQQSGGGMGRYATLVIGGSEPPLEATITVLPFDDSQRDDYVLANLNRWRGQMGLEPLSGADWKAETEASQELITVPREQDEVSVVRLQGQTEQHGETLMLAAMFLPSSAAPELPFDYVLPDGWTLGAPRPVRIATFEIGEVDLSVTRFPGGGSNLDNINRWRGQVKLEPIDEAALETAIEKLTVDGKESYITYLEGSEQSILAAAIADGEQQWFFKAQGPVAAVQAEREKFRTFMDSVKFQ